MEYVIFFVIIASLHICAIMHDDISKQIIYNMMALYVFIFTIIIGAIITLDCPKPDISSFISMLKKLSSISAILLLVTQTVLLSKNAKQEHPMNKKTDNDVDITELHENIKTLNTDIIKYKQYINNLYRVSQDHSKRMTAVESSVQHITNKLIESINKLL